jgi:hypothetical protein
VNQKANEKQKMKFSQIRRMWTVTLSTIRTGSGFATLTKTITIALIKTEDIKQQNTAKSTTCPEMTPWS